MSERPPISPRSPRAALEPEQVPPPPKRSERARNPFVIVGNAASTVSMSSTKSSTGHLLGAAGAVEAIFCILAIRDNVAPPTINLDNPSVDTAIDLVPQKARQREIRVALSNSFGFGGTNASLIFKHVDA